MVKDLPRCANYGAKRRFGWRRANWSLSAFVVFDAEHESGARWSRDRSILLRAVRKINT